MNVIYRIEITPTRVILKSWVVYGENDRYYVSKNGIMIPKKGSFIDLKEANRMFKMVVKNEISKRREDINKLREEIKYLSQQGRRNPVPEVQCSGLTPS